MKDFVTVLRISCLIFVGIVTISLIIGPKCISVEQETVEVIVVNEYYRSGYTTPMPAGKAIIIQTHPAVYQITVKYNDTEYTIDDEDTYNRYKDRIGETTTGTLEIRTYEDGSVRYFIVSLE